MAKSYDSHKWTHSQSILQDLVRFGSSELPMNSLRPNIQGMNTRPQVNMVRPESNSVVHLTEEGNQLSQEYMQSVLNSSEHVSRMRHMSGGERTLYQLQLKEDFDKTLVDRGLGEEFELTPSTGSGGREYTGRSRVGNIISASDGWFQSVQAPNTQRIQTDRASWNLPDNAQVIDTKRSFQPIGPANNNSLLQQLQQISSNYANPAYAEAYNRILSTHMKPGDLGRMPRADKGNAPLFSDENEEGKRYLNKGK